MPLEGRRQARALTLSDQLAVPDTPDLRDLLRTHNTSRRRRRQCLDGTHRSSITLASIIAADKRDSPRTLLDVLQHNEEEEEEEEEEEGEPSEGRALRPRRGEAAWTQSADAGNSVETQVPPPPPEPEITTLEVVLAENPPPSAAADLTERPVRLSLMALLEQTELSVGGGGGMVPMPAEEEDEEEKAVCCVCMARRKGAAFIPCGHTFCRQCSRELWVRRGSCPLCNASIVDVLDIY